MLSYVRGDRTVIAEENSALAKKLLAQGFEETGGQVPPDMSVFTADQVVAAALATARKYKADAAAAHEAVAEAEFVAKCLDERAERSRQTALAALEKKKQLVAEAIEASETV